MLRGGSGRGFRLLETGLELRSCCAVSSESDSICSSSALTACTALSMRLTSRSFLLPKSFFNKGANISTKTSMRWRHVRGVTATCKGAILLGNGTEERCLTAQHGDPPMALAGDRSPLNMGLVTPHFNHTPPVLAASAVRPSVTMNAVITDLPTIMAFRPSPARAPASLLREAKPPEPCSGGAATRASAAVAGEPAAAAALEHCRVASGVRVVCY